MKRLNQNNELFTQLGKHPPNWWNKILSEKDVYFDIRKGNYIDIYFNGGNIVQGLKFKNNKYSGSINYKYLLSQKSEYIKFDFSQPKLQLDKESISLLSFEDFNNKSLKRIKDNIKNYYPASSEKGIQAKFVNNSGYFIDTELAYIYKNINLRIDLVWIDVPNKKILFIELKTIGDSRLYTDEIYDQLKKYYDFAKFFENEIIQYYQKVFKIKKTLKLLPEGLINMPTLEGFTLFKKPLLLFGDCEQKWINHNAKHIDARIKKVAVGAYYFGRPDYNCDIIKKSKRNRHIF